MDSDLRIKLADIGLPEALADCIVNHYPDIEIPIPLDHIANAVGIIEIAGQKTAAFEGALVTNEAKTTGSIAYNLSSGIERRRFTIAHELGHFLILSHGASAQCAKADMGVIKSQDAKRHKEAEANRFSASLLMPKSLFVRDIHRLGAPETEHIVSLASKYKVSKEAAAWRYTDLCEHACAIIFSHQGLVRYFCKTDSFPFIEVQPRKPLPADSLSARQRGEPGNLTEWTETAPETWLGSSRRLAGKVVYEQFLEQQDGYRLTMLTIDDMPDEEEPDEDAQLEESWAVRFRRR